MNELRAFREALDIKQASVAKKLAVSRQAVHELETRPFDSISAETIRRYRAAVKSLVADRTSSEASAQVIADTLRKTANGLLATARILEGVGADV